ncbi:Copper amine oxidase 1 [Ceratocystis fimbriata CBS 114723]|uniref:Amine oxidase n=1 Tax=Ceratocystis fimbriata CBS 114723 TaxID=1035309 RepID=A0A2C5WX93_9PEZI|nr:Copper amine oxidase 1 [Ceratocystis fimbriata CBS 114723]
MSRPHPLDPLGPHEISKATAIVREHFPPATSLVFRVATLYEPRKAELLPFLDDVARGLTPAVWPVRMARVHVIAEGCTSTMEMMNRDTAANTVDCSGKGKNTDGKAKLEIEIDTEAEVEETRPLFEFHVDLDAAKVAYREHKKGKHSYIDANFMGRVQDACLADASIQAEIAKMALPAGSSVVVEPWEYSTDGLNDVSKRTTMCWFYLRRISHPDTNYYAYPLDLCAEVSDNLAVINIYRLPSAAGDRVHQNAQPFDDRRTHSSAIEYHPELRPAPRMTTRPYQIVQPEGPSFHVRGNAMTWEKWTFRIGFNYREGLTLHDVRYDGRPLFYRLALAEMFVPYADPRCPYPRKAAFDLGCDGAGINANNLKLGCDCLGYVKYFDAWHVEAEGTPLRLENVVCCHEQDDGILWKHSSFRSGNAVVVRSRILVLQTIITVSNYEYIFAFHFGQDASIHYEVRATGILSTAPMNIGDPVPPYGTLVAPGVLAPYHQHLFCLRIDPMLDGANNSVQVEESHAMPVDDPDTHNPFRVGYTTTSTMVEKEQGLDLDHKSARVFKIINEGKTNPITGTPVGFKLVPAYSQQLLAHPTSFHARRSEFGQHAVWVTRYHDDELYPAGTFTMQSSGGDGIASAIARRTDLGGDESAVRDRDIVVWHTFGSTHNPRIEDWPVMPSEKMVVGLKPVNFFTENPGIDVAVSTQENNKSVMVCCAEDNEA